MRLATDAPVRLSPRLPGPSAVPAWAGVPGQGHGWLPSVSQDVGLAQPPRQELHATPLPRPALPRPQGDAAATGGEAGGPAEARVPEDAQGAGVGRFRLPALRGCRYLDSKKSIYSPTTVIEYTRGYRQAISAQSEPMLVLHQRV